jgi:hypothetical protein
MRALISGTHEQHRGSQPAEAKTSPTVAAPASISRKISRSRNTLQTQTII